MKKLVLAAAFTAAASTAFAGTVVEPIIEPPVIVEETTGSSGGFVLPLILLAVVIAAVGDVKGFSGCSECTIIVGRRDMLLAGKYLHCEGPRTNLSMQFSDFLFGAVSLHAYCLYRLS